MMRQGKLKERITRLNWDENGEQRQRQQEVVEHLHCNPCHLITLESREEAAEAVYTVGLWHSFGHPELITVGLPAAVGQQLLGDLYMLIKLGQPPAVSLPLGQGSDYYPIQLEPVRDRLLIRESLPMADWFYSGEAFPVLQLFWSDSAGRCSGQT